MRERRPDTVEEMPRLSATKFRAGLRRRAVWDYLVAMDPDERAALIRKHRPDDADELIAALAAVAEGH